MSRLTLTPGMESRLDGAPETELEAQDLEAAAAYFQTQGMDYEEALQAAMQHLASRKQAAAARDAGLAQASQQRQAAWDMAGTDQRPTDVMEAEADYDRELATDIAGSYRQDGPVLRPGTPGFAARDRRMAMEGAPFTRGRSEDPIDDDVALRQEYERRFGRPPRTQEEVDFARTLMVDDFQTAGGERKWSQAPGRWGSQQPFESQQQMDAYEASSPGQPSQLQADMYRSQGGPMVLRQYEDGGRGPAIAAPMPGIGEQYQVYNPETGGYEVRTRDGNTPLSGGTSNAAFQDSLEAPLRRTDLERPKEWGGDDNLPTLVEGPAGPEWVYRMSPEAQAEATRKRDAFLYEQRVDRLARRAGQSYQDVDETLPLPENLQGDDDMAMRQLKRDARRGYEDRKAAQVANARRIQTENAQMNSGQLGLQMQEMDPGFRQVMLLDRLTQGRRGGATPLDVQAQSMENAMPVIRSALAGAMQGMDPQARMVQEMNTRAAILAMPPERQVAFSRLQGERMGAGYSAQPVGERWKYWMLDDGPSSMTEREEGFRKDMIALGYSEPEIDAFIDARMNSPEGPGAAPSSPRPEPSSRVPVPQGGRRGRPPSAPFKMPPSGGGRGRSGTLPRNRG
jgi:hypothetical protein